ncbi:MAG: hypothetical protein H0T94_12055 [Acidimicrobiia bacterium]|nr:hypothetical protein [Acidimicrobiia bacterium]
MSPSTPTSTMVVVPFLAEDPELVVRTLELAATHPRVSEVVGIHGDDPETVRAVKALASGLRIIPQRRIGRLRAGKGDAINTGFDYFLRSKCDRLHFYDADIKTFEMSWIDQAESGLDLGFDTVRHFYPRAATDGMVTAMLVRPALAMRWPYTALARLKQPLSGEIAFTRRSATAIASERLVREQSDWGIDTAITGITAHLGFSIYENYVVAGKDHQLYGSLAELKTMFWECLGALQLLMRDSEPQQVAHHTDSHSPPTLDLLNVVAFDAPASEKILQKPLTASQRELLRTQFKPEYAEALNKKQLETFDTTRWLDILRVLITRAVPSDLDWQTVAFQLWVARVLHFNAFEVEKGYTHAIEYIEAMITKAMLNPVN